MEFEVLTAKTRNNFRILYCDAVYSCSVPTSQRDTLPPSLAQTEKAILRNVGKFIDNILFFNFQVFHAVTQKCVHFHFRIFYTI